MNFKFYYLIRGVYNYEIWGVRVCQRDVYAMEAPNLKGLSR